MVEGQVSDGKLFVHRGASEGEKSQEQLLFTAEPGKHVENELAHFVDCVERGERPLTDGRRSLQSLRVIWKLYEAEEQGIVADLRGLGIGDL